MNEVQSLVEQTNMLDEVSCRSDNLNLRAENAELKKSLKSIKDSQEKLQAKLDAHVLILQAMRKTLLQCRNTILEDKNTKAVLLTRKKIKTPNYYKSFIRKSSNKWAGVVIIGLAVAVSGILVGNVLSVLAGGDNRPQPFVRLKLN